MKSATAATLLSAICLAALSLTLSASASSGAPAVSSNPSPASPDQLLNYYNDRWHFSIAVPLGTKTLTSDDQGGEIILFLDAHGNDQFQISAWPYEELDVQADAFSPRHPSDDGDQQLELGTIGIVRGDTIEFLFHKNGVTYDVETPPQNATSTLEVLRSWEFN